MSFYDWCIESNNEFLLNEWNYNKNHECSPKTEFPHSKNKVWWKCSVCKHEWQTTIYYRYQGHGCPECAKKKVSMSRRTPVLGHSLADLFPEHANEWHPTKNGDLKPSNISSKSHQKVWWLGKCGYEWEAVVSSRSNGNGCPSCYQERRKNHSKRL